MLATRFEINGERHYRTGDKPDKAYPSVTTILGKCASESSKKALRNWIAKNPGGSAAAAARGTAVHEACEAYIRGKEITIEEEYLPFWDGLSKHLDRYDEFLWSEMPLRPEWAYCTGDDGISRVWSHKYQYCGCPDLIGVRNDTVIIGDFKTSNQPYSRYYPKGKDDRSRFTGWNKFNKCAMQLGAYSIAIEESLGLVIDCAQIIVSTPEIDQSFILNTAELDKYKTKWLQKIRKYQEIKAEEEKAKHILKELKEELENSRDDLTSSDVSTDTSNKADHCKATV
tara:strand:+ start:1270 stop:2121 length:852 start_codon:yes stop_codon:yes gene_type:complete